MLTWDYTIYLGENTDTSFVGCITDAQFFILLSASDESEESFHKHLDAFKETISAGKVAHLDDFVQLIDSALKAFPEPPVAISAAYMVDSVMYFVTRGSGEVFASRGGQAQKLMSGDLTSSGFLQEHDHFLLTNSAVSKQTTDEHLQELTASHMPKESIEMLTPELKAVEDAGMYALFMQAHSPHYNETVLETVEEPDEAPQVPSEGPIDEPMGAGDFSGTPYQREISEEDFVAPAGVGASLPSRSQPGANFRNVFARFQISPIVGKRVTFAVVILLLCVLGWSVFSGNARRQKAKFVEEVTAAQTDVDRKLSEARDLVGLNNKRALQLVSEAQNEYETLADEAESKKLTSVAELIHMKESIDEVQGLVQKKENGSAEEYYDLNLIEKGATAKKMFVDGDTMALLDTQNNKVYVLEVKEKSVDTFSSSKVADASAVALHQGLPYIFGEGIGVVRLNTDKKDEEMVKKDDDWDSVKDMWMYSGNIYLLDSGKNEIDKYVVAEGGYSEKRAYIATGQSINLDDATAMAIDSSMYIANGDVVTKLVSGGKASFSVSIPDDSSVTFDDIYTAKDTDFVYLMDKKSQRIFVTGKDGEFKKQISAKIIGKADDFVVVDGTGILILAENKLYLVKE